MLFSNKNWWCKPMKLKNNYREETPIISYKVSKEELENHLKNLKSQKDVQLNASPLPFKKIEGAK